VNDAPPQEPVPQPVDDVPREPGVFGLDQPIGEDDARVLARGHADRSAVGEDRGRGAARLARRLARIEGNDLLFPLVGGLVADLGEEGRHAGKPLFGPLVGPLPQERQCHGLGDALRGLALHGAVEVHLAHAEVAAVGREHLPDEPVIGQILANAGANPAVIGLGRIGPEVDGELGLHPQQIAPLHRPIVGKLLPLQEAIDQQAALLGVLIQQELPRLLRGGQGADDVQVGPPHKHLVGAHVRRLDAQPLQPAEDQIVDPALGSAIHAGRQGTARRCCRAGVGQGRCHHNGQKRRCSHGFSLDQRVYVRAQRNACGNRSRGLSDDLTPTTAAGSARRGMLRRMPPAPATQPP